MVHLVSGLRGETKAKLVSIIVPIYNVEPYLDKCIESIVNQEYGQIEVLMLNDGSLDNSAEIIKKWALRDGRIKYYYHENRGVAFTRNRGLELAQGEFACFVDGDDVLEKSAISELIAMACRAKADITIGNFYFKKGRRVIRNTSIHNGVFEVNDLSSTQLKYDMFYSNGRPMASVCNKLYRLSFLRKSNVKFEEGIISEDRLFNLKCLTKEPKLALLNKYTYCCNIRSSSRSRSYRDDYYRQSLALFTELHRYLKENGLYIENKDLLELTLLSDIEKIYSYVYHYSRPRVRTMIHITKSLKKEDEVCRTLRQLFRDGTLKRVLRGRNRAFAYAMLGWLLLNAPNIITSMYFVLYKLLMGIREEIIFMSRKYKSID